MQRKHSDHIHTTISSQRSLHDLCEHLSDSHYEKSLVLTGLIWDDTTSLMLARTLARNYGLKTVTLDGIPDQDEENVILAGLKRNIDILEFKLECSNECEKEIKWILQRNFQFRIAQRLLVDALIRDASCDSEHGKNTIADICKINQSEATANEVSEVLFHARMKTQFEEPALSEQIQLTRDLLRQLKNAGIEHDVTALQAAAVKNMPEYVSGLIQLGADVNLQNARGQTVLLAAATRGNLNIVKILCENGADKSIADHGGTTAIKAALENRRFDIVNYLSPDMNAQHMRRLISKRNLVVGLGPMLFQSLPEFSKTNFHYFGGTPIEGFAILSESLKQFCAIHPYDNTLKRITNGFQTALNTKLLDTDAQLKMLKRDGKLHTVSGCIDHLVGITVQSLSDSDFEMTLADRGLFSSRLKTNKNNDKIPSIQSIIISKKLLGETLELINQAADLDLDTAEKILFGIIPLMTGNTWKPVTNMHQSKLKSGTCFFSNIKTLLRYEFQQSYPAQTGYSLYKKFSLFLRERLINDYEKFTHDEDPYLFISKRKLDEKVCNKNERNHGK